MTDGTESAFVGEYELKNLIDEDVRHSTSHADGRAGMRAAGFRRPHQTYDSFAGSQADAAATMIRTLQRLVCLLV